MDKKNITNSKDIPSSKNIGLLEVIKGLLKYPLIFILIILALFLNLIQEIFKTDKLILIFQLLGIIIIAALCTIILITMKNGKKYINKIALFSFFWLASCIVLIDFSGFKLGTTACLELIARIVTSYEFIFLGCLLPDFLSQTEKEHDDDTISKLEEHISLLEKQQSESS